MICIARVLHLQLQSSKELCYIQEWTLIRGDGYIYNSKHW
jgi:hypothetical protein